MSQLDRWAYRSQVRRRSQYGHHGGIWSALYSVTYLTDRLFKSRPVGDRAC
jgi:hypothetical protein